MTTETDKPPIEDLHQFFEFQLPRQWAPVLSEVLPGSYWKHQVNTWLRFSLLNPKLYINTIPVSLLSCIFNVYWVGVSHAYNVLVNCEAPKMVMWSTLLSPFYLVANKNREGVVSLPTCWICPRCVMLSLYSDWVKVKYQSS